MHQIIIPLSCLLSQQWSVECFHFKTEGGSSFSKIRVITLGTPGSFRINSQSQYLSLLPSPFCHVKWQNHRFWGLEEDRQQALFCTTQIHYLEQKRTLRQAPSIVLSSLTSPCTSNGPVRKGPSWSIGEHWEQVYVGILQWTLSLKVTGSHLFQWKEFCNYPFNSDTIVIYQKEATWFFSFYSQ